MTDRHLVDADASIAFAHPRVIVLGLAFAAGLLDALGYSQFGVFTANQAGNLVVGWTLLPDDPASAMLSFASIVGCGVGVALVVVLRHTWRWLGGEAGSRVLLVAAAALIVAAAMVGEALVGDAVPNAELWTSQWWGIAASVFASAAALAATATVFVSGSGMRAPILASTNAYVDAVRYGTASLVEPDERSNLRRLAWRAAGFPVAWTLGAAATVLLPFGHLTLSIGIGVAIVLTAAFARRVSTGTDSPRRTV
jgi:uncharacterized membrane protein YoaK (UPF0700 family)